MDEFSELKTGMSYDEAVKVIGFEGEESSSNDIAGTKTIMYTWTNSDFGNMNAMFQNDKMMSKSQFGLK